MADKEAQINENEDRLDEEFAKYLESLETNGINQTNPFVTSSPELAQIMSAHEQLGQLMAPLQEFAVTQAYKSDQTTTLSPGTVIGDYEIIEEIGRGGMGIVYKARNRKFNIVAALKMISSGQRATEEERTRFLAEVEHQGNLNHPNIVRVTGGGEYDGHLYFTMTLIERKDGKASLEKHLDRFKNDPIATIKLMRKVALAIRYANQRGILHRDLKPGNVLLDEEGNPHVTDFGLAKQLSHRDEWEVSPETQNIPTAACSMLAGTVSYMSPEQAEGDKYLTVRSDVYGLGAILYELLTGVPPCKADSFEEAWKRAKENKIATPRSLNPAINPDLEAVCLQCLRKDPDSRYESGKHLAENLARVQNKQRPDKVKWPLWKHIWFCMARNPAVTAMVFCALLLAGVGVQEWIEIRRLDAINHAADVKLAAKQKAIKDAALNSAHFTAGLVASILHNRIDDLKQAVEEAAKILEANHTLITRVDETKDFDNEVAPFPEFDQFLEDLVNNRKDSTGNPIFVTGAYYNREGTMVSHSSINNTERKRVIGKDFKYRDYFKGAMSVKLEPNGTSVYVSKLYKSLSGGFYQIGFSRVIYSKTHPREPIGLLYASIKTSKTMGISSLEDHDYQTVLVGPGDQGKPAFLSGVQPLPEHVVVLHPSYAKNSIRNPNEDAMVVAFPKELLDDFEDGKCDDYRDPVSQSSFLAGCAPVKGTNFKVIIQVKHDPDLTPPD
jgi:tRNA A-37 threonylcarbamoyl transferase component Bud32